MTDLFDPTAPLTPSGNLRRREVVSRMAAGGATAAALLALGVLGIVVYTVVKHGAGSFNLDFIVKAPPLFGGAGGESDPNWSARWSLSAWPPPSRHRSACSLPCT